MLHSYAPSDVDIVCNAPRRVYVIIGKETGESRTPYLQGYITFATAKRLSAVRMIVQAHWSVAKGSSEHNIAYPSPPRHCVVFIMMIVPFVAIRPAHLLKLIVRK